MNIADWIALIVLIALFISFWIIGPVQILIENWRRGEKKEGIKIKQIRKLIRFFLPCPLSIYQEGNLY